MDGFVNQGGGHGKFTMTFWWRLFLKAGDGEKREPTPLAVSNGPLAVSNGSEITWNHSSSVAQMIVLHCYAIGAINSFLIEFSCASSRNIQHNKQPCLLILDGQLPNDHDILLGFWNIHQWSECSPRRVKLDRKGLQSPETVETAIIQSIKSMRHDEL